MANLLGQNIGTNYKGFLNVDSTINTPLDTTLRSVTDGMGNVSALSLSTEFAKITGTGLGIGGGVIIGSRTSTEGAIWNSILTTATNNYGISFGQTFTIINATNQVYFDIANGDKGFYNTNGFAFGTGTITQNGVLTVKGLGANIQSWRDTSNNEVASVSNGGSITGGAIYSNSRIGLSSKSLITSSVDGKLSLTNYAITSFTSLSLGPETSSFPMLKVNGTILEIRLGDDSNYAALNTNKLYMSGAEAITEGSGMWYSSSHATRYSSFTIGSGQSVTKMGARLHTSGSWTFADTTEVTSAIVAITSTSKGFLPPRMTTAQRTAISSPAAGLIVYDTDTNKSYTYDGSTWQAHW
jgi:hypothetical protein